MSSWYKTVFCSLTKAIPFVVFISVLVLSNLQCSKAIIIEAPFIDKKKWIQYFDNQDALEIKKLVSDATSGVYPDTNSLYPEYTRSSHYLRECAWQLDALLTMYEATGEQKYLDHFVSTANLFFNPHFWNTMGGERIGKKQIPSWSTARYSISLIKNYNFNVDLAYWNNVNAIRVPRIDRLPNNHLPKYLISSHYRDTKKYSVRISTGGFIEQKLKPEELSGMLEKSGKESYSLRSFFCAKSLTKENNAKVNLRLKLGNTIFLNRDFNINESWKIIIADIVNKPFKKLRESKKPFTIRISNPSKSNILIDLVHLQQYTDYILHDSNILVPLLKFSTVVREKKLSDFEKDANRFIDTSHQIINKWLHVKKHLRKSPENYTTIYWPDPSSYVSNWQTIDANNNLLKPKHNRFLPYNMVFQFAQALYWYDKSNHSEEYLYFLKEVSEWFVETSNIKLQKGGNKWYNWNYYSGESGEKVRTEDIDHARLDIATFCLFNNLYKEGHKEFSFFSDEKFPHFANTFLHQARFKEILDIEETELEHFQPAFLIDGRSSTNTRFIKYGLTGLLDLTPFNRDVWRVAHRLYEGYINSNKRLTAARQTATLASIIKYWPD